MLVDVLGFKDRGIFKEGWNVDINIIDMDEFLICYLYYVNDFFYNGGWFIVKFKGYVVILVVGKVVV